MESDNLTKPYGRGRSYIIIAITIYAAYAVFGFSDSARGPAIPRIQEEFGLTELQLGILMTVNAIGYLIACSYTAVLAKKIGMKTCLIIALAVAAASGALICFSPSFMMLVLAFFVLNLGFGMMEISLGVIAATTFTKNTGTMLNLAHFFYGAGAVFSPVVSTSLMAVRFGGRILGWRYMYLIVLSFALIPVIPAMIGRLKKQDYDKKKTGYPALLKKTALWLTIMIFALSVTCEVGIVAWLVNFLEKAYSYTNERAALYLTLFFICFTLARLVIGPITDKIGFINSLTIMSAFAGIMITAGVLGGEAWAPLLFIAGIGIAPIFPTMMAVTAKLFSDEIDLAMTAITTIMGIIMVPANLLVGSIIHQTRPVLTSIYGEDGVRLAYSAGYLFLGLCCFGAFVFIMLLRRKQKKAGQLV